VGRVDDVDDPAIVLRIVERIGRGEESRQPPNPRRVARLD